MVEKISIKNLFLAFKKDQLTSSELQRLFRLLYPENKEITDHLHKEWEHTPADIKEFNSFQEFNKLKNDPE